MGVDLEWEIGDEEAPPATEWTNPSLIMGREREEGFIPRPSPMFRPRPERRRWRAWILAALIFGAVALAALWLIQEQWRRQLEGELRSTLLLEAQALARGDREIFLGLQDPQDEKWRRAQSDLLDKARQADIPADQVEIIALGVEGDWAWAEVRAPRPAAGLFRQSAAAGAALIEQVQFYRRIDDRWKRVAPSPDFLAYWGEAAALEAPYLQVEFPERDRPQVEAWLAALGPYAQEVCLDLGCPAEMRLSIVLSPTLDLDESLQQIAPDAIRLSFPSPHASGIRQDHLHSEEPMLIALSFSLMAVAQSSGSTMAAYEFEGRGLPARVTLARAIFYHEFDRAVALLATPEFQAEWANFKETLMNPLSQGEWLSLAQMDLAPSWRAPEGQAWTLVEYVAETYGREHIGELLRAAQSAPSLSEALRTGLAVQDVNAFERNWRSFVAARLGQARRDVPLRP
jgi:hypothetical protein